MSDEEGGVRGMEDMAEQDGKRVREQQQGDIAYLGVEKIQHIARELQS